jgi:predicted dehydrogenase
MNAPIGLSAASVSASAASSSVGRAPLRIGLIGLDRGGMFHAERLSLRSDLTLIAACDPSTAGTHRLPGPHVEHCRLDSRVEDLLARTDLEAVLIAGPTSRRADWAEQALAAGKDVALDPLPCDSAARMRELLASAARMGTRLSVLATRRGGIEFRTALQIVRSGRLGSVTSARLVSWGKAVPADRGSESADKTTEVDPFAFFAYQYVDQLLQLLGRPPRSLYARVVPTSRDEPNAAAFTLALTFEPAGHALIDVNLHSGVVVQTGWILAGERGGYSAGKTYWEESSGEVCDAPVGKIDLPEIDVYAELLASAQSERGPTTSAKDAEVVLRVIDAARESSRTGQTISLDP